MGAGLGDELDRAMKRWILAALVLPLPTWTEAQSSPEEIDPLLAGTAGVERLERLVTLTTTHRRDHAARAVGLGEEALELLRSHPDRARQLEVLNSLSYAHVILGNYDPALELGSRAEELARELGDESARAFAFRNLGRVYRSSSAYDRALEAYEKATELFTEAREMPGLGDALNDTGIVHWMLGDYPKALDFFIQARQMYEKTADLERIAGILNNTGMVHRRMEHHARALELYQQALEIRRRVGPDGAISNVLNNIGNVYRDLGEPARALDYYLESLEVGPKDQHGYGNTLMNLGSAYQDLGDLDRAMRFYRQAIEVKEALGDEQGVAQTLFRIGAIERLRGDLSAALETVARSLAIHERLATKAEIKDAQLELSEIYAAMGRYREALDAFRRHERVKSEIFNQENSEAIAEMEARFESDRKQKEIELLKQQQAIGALEVKRHATARRAAYGGVALLSLVVGLLFNRYRLKARSSRLIARQNRELEDAMAELKASEHERRRLEDERIRRQERERYIDDLEAKNAEVETRNAEIERLAYTLSHDLKTPLVTIRGFVGLLRMDTLTGDVERADDYLGRIERAARHMSRLLEELLEMLAVGRVVSVAEEVPLGALAREVVELVADDRLARRVAFEVAPDLPAVFGDRRRLAEVLRNLIENAVQFSVDQPRPRVEVSWRRQGSETVFTVGDNGIGIEPRYQVKIFGLFERLDAGVEGTGVGLALVKRIVEAHGGRVWVESEGLGHGSTFCFTLPGFSEVDRAARLPPLLRPSDYHMLFEHAHDAVLILDPDRERVLDANRRACQIYGFDRDDFVGRSMLDLTAAHRQAADHVKPTLESNGRYSFETIQLRQDGSEIRLEVHASAIEFRGRKAILSINRDVTRRRRQEEELARYRAELEDRVQDRTARLEQANRTLASKNTELESFSYAIAHGFKSPLVTIRGYLSLLEKETAEHCGDRLAHPIEQVQHATLKMGRFIDHLLALSRAGRVIEQPSEIGLGELVSATADMLSGVLGERGIELLAAPDLPALYGDPSRLGEVLQNLVENAVKYMGDQPAPRIEIGAHRQDDEIVVTVRDNGSGLDAADREKIFDLFERAGTGVADGMGIGLALSKRIIEIHGGRIWAESAGRGGGSAFKFTLPVRPS